MDSRSLLNKLKKVGVFIDSYSFEEFLDIGNRESIALLNYSNMKCIKCIRTPFKSKYDELTEITEYRLIINEEEIETSHTNNSIIIEGRTFRTTYPFRYRLTQIKDVAQRILKTQSITDNEFNTILLVFIQATFNKSLTHRRERDEIFIFVTQNELLLVECHN